MGSKEQQQEAQFQERLTQELASKLRYAFLFAAALFGLFVWLDYLLDPQVLGKNVPIRAATVGVYLVLHRISRAAHAVGRAYLLLYVGILVGGASIAALSVGMSSGQLLALGSLMLMVVVLAALSTTLRRTSAGFALLIVVFNLLAPLMGADRRFMFSVDVFLIAGSFAGVMMGFITERLARRAFRLERELERLATTDSLTEARNRGSFLEVTRGELIRAQRTMRPVSLLLLDIDRFKNINDTYGHPVGDAVIRTLADTARGVLRASDTLGRIGGEEFAILLPETSAAQSQHVAERLREAVAEQRLHLGGAVLEFTVSMGAAVWAPGEPLERLFSRADEALYAAKRGGRNRVCAA